MLTSISKRPTGMKGKACRMVGVFFVKTRRNTKGVINARGSHLADSIGSGLSQIRYSTLLYSTLTVVIEIGFVVTRMQYLIS